MKLPTKPLRGLVAACAVLACAVTAAFVSQPALAADTSGDTALLCIATNIARGAGNFYLYVTFSNKHVPVAEGDTLEYDVFLAPSCPAASGGVDVALEGCPALRDSGATDQQGVRAHGKADLKAALGRWYHRSIPLDSVKGFTTTAFNIQFEGDVAGAYAQAVDNVVITHADGSREVIYQDGPPPVNALALKEGYSKYCTLTAVPREQVQSGPALKKAMEDALAHSSRERTLEDLRCAMQTANDLVRPSATPSQQKKLDESAAAFAALQKDQALQGESFDSAARQVRDGLAWTQPLIRRFTGHLVGHAHIDFQWLWEWPETLQVCKDTFGQALRFMDEVPDFTFTQSSAGLYMAMEENQPELFAQIKRRVSEGRWEFVGGRITEADTNMLSPESHAREFLYGQSWFREHFGRAAVVAWEPDTFGHTWQMPQIATLGGCRYYYFWRTGKGYPLFWWQAPDGTRILTFDEDATPGGSSYNGDVTDKNLSELEDFHRATGANDVLWVYGVGNHGGGPTREQIMTAKSWQKQKDMPQVRFSTAERFFRTVEKSPLKKLPLLTTDMNTTFEGCYTTHGDIKRLNRDAEASLESAETASAIAMQYGLPYPGAMFRRLWEDLCMNQHHDTIDGTCIGPSYTKTRQMVGNAVRSARNTSQAAADYLAGRSNLPENGLLVLNPVAFTRAAIVAFDPVPFGQGDLVAHAPDGTASPVQRCADGKARFVAASLPSAGWRVYQIAQASAPSAGKEGCTVSADGTHLSSSLLDVHIDPASGVITQVMDRSTGREVLRLGGSVRLETHWEKPGMDAWTLGEIAKVETLGGPVTLDVVENGPVTASVRISRMFRSSKIVQTVSLTAGIPWVDLSLAVDWHELGQPGQLNPMLRLACDVNAEKPAFTLDVPFAAIGRPTDGHEYPALKWMDLSGTSGGASLINDCRHGTSAKDGTMRLSLLRCPFHPDPAPDQGLQQMGLALLPHSGDWKQADTARLAWSYNHPVVVSAQSGLGKPVLESSLVSFGKEDIVPTVVKRAEDGKGLVVRFYESAGVPCSTTMQAPVSAGARIVNFLEDDLGLQTVKGGAVQLDLRPWEIRSVRLLPVQ